MRKWIVLLLLLALCLGSVYLFIPAKASINEQLALPLNNKAFSRVFFDESTWPQWWPNKEKDQVGSPANFVYNGKTYRVTQKRFTSLVVTVVEGEDSLATEALLLPVENGTVQLAWSGTMRASNNPFVRIKRWLWTKSVAADIRSLLANVQKKYPTEDQLYGIPIRHELVVDSLLISTHTVTPRPLSTDSIYSLIDRLKSFAQTKGARQTGYPMLNISQSADSNYLTRVALPVNKRLADEGEIEFRWMLGNGNILASEIKGGPAQIKKAFLQMENYIDDNNRTAPAIEFQSLLTDRRKEQDTSKWVTKLYWPVM